MFVYLKYICNVGLYACTSAIPDCICTGETTSVTLFCFPVYPVSVSKRSSQKRSKFFASRITPSLLREINNILAEFPPLQVNVFHIMSVRLNESVEPCILITVKLLQYHLLYMKSVGWCKSMIRFERFWISAIIGYDNFVAPRHWTPVCGTG